MWLPSMSFLLLHARSYHPHSTSSATGHIPVTHSSMKPGTIEVGQKSTKLTSNKTSIRRVAHLGGGIRDTPMKTSQWQSKYNQSLKSLHITLH